METFQLILKQEPELVLSCKTGDDILQVSLKESSDLLLGVSPYLVIYSDETVPTESFIYPFTNAISFTVTAETHGLTKVSNVTVLDSDNIKMLATVQINNDFSVFINFSKAYTGKLIIY